MRRGVRLGLDIGTVRIGVAVSDVEGILATPHSTVQRSADNYEEQLRGLCERLDVLEVLVGLPLALSGSMTASTRDALAVASALQSQINVDVRMIDERLTTVSAHSALRQVGKKQKQTRQVIDQVAAVLILQHSLEIERAQGTVPGKLIGDIQD
ncbi:Holliday junction resolvase RuvX [Alpinimonas psychrophila]|uniref:Putative pre-16S rRNA nuclease n=1 Tax=Alpinimonas psychrophila TaxID=748908 RepID=A0A7W3JST0_9MICO|nr:Holliday junction resolvase RuvX [Alpinimonas psychrophila]MBA8828530.1 putative Holliday junction resolvase [Alpinimonas psychrophila]